MMILEHKIVPGENKCCLWISDFPKQGKSELFTWPLFSLLFEKALLSGSGRRPGRAKGGNAR